MDNVLRIGDKVAWRGTWGKDPIEEATIEIITLTDSPYSKGPGVDVYSVKFSTLKEGNVIIDLDNGHWAYGNQVAPAGNDPEKWHDV